MKNLLFILASAFLVSFSGNDDVYKKQINSHFPDWIAYLKKINPQFSHNYFHPETDRKYEYDYEQPMDDPEDTIAKKVRFWSPDSLHYADIFYGTFSIVDDNGKLFLEAWNPECAFWLTSVKKKKDYRLAYYGTDFSFEDVAWFGNSCVAVAGSERSGYNSTKHHMDSLSDFVEVFDFGNDRRIFYKGAPFYFPEDADTFITWKIAKMIYRK